MAVEAMSQRWLGCVVCGDDSELVAIAHHPDETEVMCARCGQARLVPVLARQPENRPDAQPDDRPDDRPRRLRAS